MSRSVLSASKIPPKDSGTNSSSILTLFNPSAYSNTVNLLCEKLGTVKFAV